MKVALDAMGGDRAPAAAVEGALRALEAYADVELVLVGDPAAIETAREASDTKLSDADRWHVHDAPQVVGMDDDPVKAVRSSSKVSARACADLLRAGEVDGVVTMGNTGAAVAAATLYCRRLKGVRRLGIAAPFPRPGGVSVLLDAGANPDSSADELYQYAVMGTHYVRAAFGVATPRVGILSIGEEEHKGNRLVHETWERFRAQPLEGFVGNVEPRELFEDRADVVVSDGFAGNLVLKAAEGMAEFLLGTVGRELGERGVKGTREVLGAVTHRVDYSQYGGAPLLGLQGGYMIGHGRSGPAAFVSAVGAVRTYVQGEVGAHIVAHLAEASPAASPEDA